MKSSTAMSEREVEVELRKIASTLAPPRIPVAGAKAMDGGDEWEDRRAALEQLQRFAEEDVSARPIFAQLASSTLKVPLLNQLSGSRAPIVRAACAAITAFASCSSKQAVWFAMSVWVTWPLLGLTANVVKVVAQAAAETLQHMARRGCFGADTVGELLKGCRASHAVVRRHGMDVLLALMRHSKGTPQQARLAKFAAPLSRVIAAGVADADQEVRRRSRHCYWGLAAMEPDVAARLRNGIDAPTRTLIDRERADALFSVGAVDAAGGDTPTTGRLAAARPASPVSRGGDALLLHEELRTVAALRARSRFPLTPSSGGGRAPPGTRRPVRSVSASPSGAPTDSPPRASESTPATPGHLTVTGPSARIGILVKVTAAGTEVCSPAADSALNEWKVIKGSLASTDWKARLDGVLLLRCRLPAMRASHDVTSEAIGELARRIADPHFRVCLVAINCFRACLSPEWLAYLRPHLHETLLSLAGDTCGRKQFIRREASHALQSLVELMPVDLVITTLFQCIDDVMTAAVRGRLLEVIRYGLEHNLKHYSDAAKVGPPMRALMRQLRGVSAERSERSSPVWPAATDALRSLRHLVPVAFLAAAGAMDGDDKAFLARILEISKGPPSPARIALSGPASPLQPLLLEDRPRVSPPATAGSPMTPARAAFSAAPTPVIIPQIEEARPPPVHSDHAVARSSDPKRPRGSPYPPGGLFGGSAARLSRPPAPPPAHRDPQEVSNLLAEYYLLPCSTFAPHSEDAATTNMPPGELTSVLGSPDSLSNELCSALDSARESMARHREQWTADECTRLMTVLFERLCTEGAQPQHTVRRRAFTALRALLELPAFGPVAARHLSCLLRVCRSGIDDAFFEVQQEASLAVRAALESRRLPADLCLSALAAAVEGWQRSASRDDSTRGWLEMLSEIGRTFERSTGNGNTGPARGDPNRSVLTEAVLRRAVQVLQWCASHCTAEVRHTAVLGLVAMWASMGPQALPFFVPLTATQQKLVSIYYNKSVLARGDVPRAAVDAMIQDILLDAQSKRARAMGCRDLNADMLAAGYPDAGAL